MFEPFSERAPAKVNLALHVLGRRADGFHDLDSIVAFAAVGDELHFAPAAAFTLTAEGRFAPELPHAADNVIARAYRRIAALVAERGKALPPVAIHLTKNLPVAAGIGGGSADAAAAMRGLLRIAGIEGLDQGIMAAALALGADVPVCLVGKACRMQGIGERIAVIEEFPALDMVLVNPGVAVATAEVFARLGLQPGSRFGAAIADTRDAATWRNDLAGPAMEIAPAIAEVLAELRRVPGVRHVTMSGSGATCVAVLSEPLPAAFRDTLSARGWWVAQA